MYWGRLVKNIRGQPKYWGLKGGITDATIDISQLLGGRATAAPRSTDVILSSSQAKKLVSFLPEFCLLTE